MSQPAGNGATTARKSKGKWLGPVVGALLAVTSGYLLLETILGEKTVFASYDIPFYVRPKIHPKEVELVYVDEASYNAFQLPQNKDMKRGYYAKLIDRMTKENAKAIAFDIVFSDANGDADDEALVKAAKANGRAVFAADFVAGSQSVSGGVKVDNLTTPPFEALENAAADVGTDEVPADDDLMNRRHVRFSSKDNYHGISWAVAKLVHAPITSDARSNEWERPRWFNYYGPDKVIPFVSLYQAVQVDPSVPEGFFSNKVVFVGQRVFTTSFSQRKDAYPAPFPNLAQENKFMPGVEIQATEFLNLLRGDWLNRLSYSVELNIILAGGVIIGAGLALCGPLLAFLFAAAGAILVALAEYLALTKLHYWFPWLVIVVGQIPIALVWSVIYNSLQLYVEKKLFEQSLSLYLSPKMVKQFAKDPALLKPGAKKQLLTILFSDIAGFTTISEGMDSDDLALAMNAYFQTAVQNCVFATDGTIVKYIGDAIFAFWNAPEEQGDHSYRACEAALKFRDQPPQYMNGKLLITRIGLHTGEANVGNFGSMTRVDYTALGENINLASRMEGLNKYLGTRVLITDDTRKVAGPKIVSRYLGLFRLKGFERSVGVHELSGRVEEEGATRELRARFAEALAVLATRNFDAAEAAFKRVLEISPEDGPAHFYLGEMAELRAEKLPDDWKGEITLKDK